MQFVRLSEAGAGPGRICIYGIRGVDEIAYFEAVEVRWSRFEILASVVKSGTVKEDAVHDCGNASS